MLEMELYLRKQLFTASIVYIGQMMVGFGLGWTAPIIPKLQDPEQTPLPGPITAVQASWVASVLYIGTIIGPYVSSYLSNRRGRKPCLFLGGILTMFAFAILAIARNLAMIFAGRIFTGLGTGILAVTNLVYIGEIASTNIRGILLTSTGIFGTLGTLVVYSVGPYVPYYATSVIGFGITALYVVGLMYVPESPMFYILQGRQEEARICLIDIGRKDEVDLMLAATKDDQKQKGKFSDLFTVRSNRKAFFITFTLGILVQLSGIVVVIFFATTIFEMAGSSIEPNIATIIIGITQIVSSSITPFFVERSGRKILLMLSTAACCLSLSILGTYFFLDYHELSIVKSIQWLPLVLLIFFFLSYDMGFGIIPGTLVGEMFGPSVRNIGSAVAITSAWLFGFGVSSIFGYMMETLGGHGTFWIFSGSCGLACLFTCLFVPETKGKTLVEIQEILINIGQVLQSIGITWCTPALAKLQDPDESPLGYAISDKEASWVVSCMYLPCIVSFSIGYSANAIGRKLTLIISAFLMLIANIMLTWSYHLVTIYIARTIEGFSMMSTCIVAIVYIGEIASPNIRGVIFTLIGISQCLGTILVYSVGVYYSYFTLGCVIVIISIIYTVACFLIPESPLFFVLKGNIAAAKKSLEKLGRTKDIEKELKTLIEHAKEQSPNKQLVRDIFTIRSNKKAFIISSVLFMITNCNGILALLMFAMSILEQAGSFLDSGTAMIIIGFVSLFGALIAPFFVDKYGRKFLLILSSSFCSISMWALAAYFYLIYLKHPFVEKYAWLPIVFMVLAVFSFAIGLAIIPNTLTGEMFRPNVRSPGTSLSLTISWAFGFIVMTSYGYIVSYIGSHVCFCFFAIVNIIAIVFTVFVVPETKGKSLIEIENMLSR